MFSRWTSALLLVGYAGIVGAQAGPAGFEPPVNKAQELRLAHLLYLAESAEPLSALAYRKRFSQAQLAGGDASKLRVKLAEQASDFGLLDAAAADYRRDLNPSVGYEARNRDWYQLAEAWYARGDYTKAQSAFDNIYGALPDDLKNKLPPFEARLMIAQGRDAEAVKLLREWRRKRVRDPFARYNLAVALARAGEQQEGAGELNAVGTLKSKQSARLALRDQANLVLGFGYLEIGQGATARTLFQRVRLDGPYSDKALLGLGWAEIAPDGERQEHTLVQTVRCIEDPARLLPDNLPVLRRIPREACGPPQEFRDTDRFKTKKGGETEADRYKKALVPWIELTRRDPRLSAVQEGLVAVPYAYAKLGDLDQADQYYAKAIRVLEPQHDNVNFAIKQLKVAPDRGAVLPPGVEPDRNWFALRWGLYTSADSAFFTDVLTDEQFRIAAQSLQDLLVLRDHLINSSTRTESLRSLLTGRRVALYRAGIALPQQLLDEQRGLDSTSKQLNELTEKVENTIYRLGEHLRLQALDSAQKHEQKLQIYLQNARVGRANAADISTAQGTTP
mgnify:CR=1 FL=1